MSTKGDVPSFNICTVPGTAVKHVAVAVSRPTEDTVVEAPTTPRVKNAADMFSSSLVSTLVLCCLFSSFDKGSLFMSRFRYASVMFRAGNCKRWEWDGRICFSNVEKTEKVKSIHTYGTTHSFTETKSDACGLNKCFIFIGALFEYRVYILVT